MRVKRFDGQGQEKGSSRTLVCCTVSWGVLVKLETMRGSIGLMASFNRWARGARILMVEAWMTTHIPMHDGLPHRSPGRPTKRHATQLPTGTQ